MDPLLDVKDLEVRYGALVALADASVTIEAGQIACVLGPNGSGKSTLVNAIAGIRKPFAGSIRLDGADLTGVPAHARVPMGISLVPERRRLFPTMTLEENLRLGAVTVPRDERDRRVSDVMDLFPLFRERPAQRARSFSGGEQQLIALGRGLVCRPKLLMVDEPFLGLSPRARAEVMRLLQTAVEQLECAVIFIEQDVATSLELSDVVLFLNAGRIVAHGDADDFTEPERVRRLFLGV